MDIAEVLDKVTPAERTVDICVDGSIASRLDDTQQRWLAAVRWDGDHNAAPTAPAVAAEIEALRAEAAAATITFRVRAVGSTTWRKLIAEHPPPLDDLEGWRWDPETFPLAAVAASTFDPAMTEDQATELADRLSDGQWAKLFAAALTVNVGDDLPKFEPGIGVPTTSVPSSITAVPEASPTRSSSENEDSPALAS
jgi:hypothetical protein